MKKFEQLMSVLGHRLGAAVLAAMMIVLCSFATPNEAQARGAIELDGGFGFAGLYGKHHSDFNGFAFTLGVRYRALDWLALGVEQDLGGIFWEDDNDYNGFYGATIFGAKFILAVSALELFGNLGIGATYVNMEYDHHEGPAHVKWDWDNAWFGLRIGVGATYKITDALGIGLNFDYTPSFDDDIVSHFLRLQLHVVFLI